MMICFGLEMLVASVRKKKALPVKMETLTLIGEYM